MRTSAPPPPLIDLSQQKGNEVIEESFEQVIPIGIGSKLGTNAVTLTNVPLMVQSHLYIIFLSRKIIKEHL